MSESAANTLHEATSRYVVMGVSGAGKSSIGARFAQLLGAQFVEGDDFHPPENRARMAAGIPLTDQDRSGWLHALADRIAAAKRENVTVVVSCSALKRAYRDILRTGDERLQFVFLDGDRTLLADRLATRHGHFMPVSLLESQLATLEAPTVDERAWVCDIREPAELLVTMLVERVISARHVPP